MFARTLALLSLSLFMLSGCASLVVSGATTTGVVAAQERTFGRAIDDATVKASIYSKFLRKDVNDLLIHVDVQVDEGRVMLTGNVNNPQTVVEAVRIAWQVEGVREVINEIQIQNKGGWQNYITDAWISNNIRGRMLLAKDVRSINYNVETVNGTVYLLGIALTQDELDKAVNIARTTKYVKEVISHVILRDDPRRETFKGVM